MITTDLIIQCGIKATLAEPLAEKINQAWQPDNPIQTWHTFATDILTPEHSFPLHLLLFSLCYPHRETTPESAVAWIPDHSPTRLQQFMDETHCRTVKDFHHWSVEHRALFWEKLIGKMPIQFIQPPKTFCNLNDPENPQWLCDAKFNITDSCFTADPKKAAIIYQDHTRQLKTISYQTLQETVNQVANSLLNIGFQPGDAIAIILPMNPLAVAIYLGIIRMGGVVVSIADSFSSDEVATRLSIANAKGVFTQTIVLRDQKSLPLYEKIIAANAPRAIVLHPEGSQDSHMLRKDDLFFENFLVANTTFNSYPCVSESHCNILFSSGTTGTPKAIPWTHTTPLKAASDAFLYHNLNDEDVIAWPTNLGWMMGPWLIFAGLVNQATVALYDDTPRDCAFGQFIERAGVTVLGVVPTLVAHWRHTNCMQSCDWKTIRSFSSTGECSNPDDMLYLMSRAGYKPILEYCGGTEIGGAYITSTLIENNCPSVLTTPTMGSDFILLDEQGIETDNGEVALIPPAIGLSNTLLNANHHDIYYNGMPIYHQKLLRRHGDQLQRLSNGAYCILGRVDDTMNIGGIKVSSAEIERVIMALNTIKECAAVAMNQHGPAKLVIFCVPEHEIARDILKSRLQQQINQHLNPLFRIHDVIIIPTLPRTASGKIMRRELRSSYT
ncbi:MAG: AMP-binding protein [Gammaproteobacteria bacterium]|nr:AMP-binding protein [Gammaproteobacteria bacterium]